MKNTKYTSGPVGINGELGILMLGSYLLYVIPERADPYSKSRNRAHSEIIGKAV
jgi:hypothetical protein